MYVRACGVSRTRGRENEAGSYADVSCAYSAEGRIAESEQATLFSSVCSAWYPRRRQSTDGMEVREYACEALV